MKEIEKIFLSLHPAQRDVYTDQLINPKSPHYNIGGYIKLKGAFNKAKFQEAIISAPDAFDAFKLRFDVDEAEPVCYFDFQYVKPTIGELDFTNNENPSAQARAWVQQRFNTPLLINEQPIPYEECLLKIAENEYWFFGKYHHLITDGYGFIVFIKYLAQKYKSLVDGVDVQFNYPPYQDEIAHAPAYFASTEYEQDKLYWKNKIGAIPKKILARKYYSQDAGSKTGATFLLDLTIGQQKMLEKMQALTGSGIQQLTIAALLIYFGKTTSQQEFVFGIPVHKRGARKLRNMVGMLSGILPYKATYQRDKKLNELLKEITLSQKADYRHQHYPIADLSRDLKAVASEGYLYQVSVDFEPFDFEPDFGDGLQAQVIRVSNDYDKNPLQLCWLQYGDEQSLKLQVYYGNAYFNQAEIDLFAKRVIFIIEQFSDALDKNIGDIETIPPHEKGLLESFNDTTATYPADKTIIDLLEEQVSKTPGAIAVVFDEQQITYKELNNLSNQVGHYLKAKGVKAGSLVPLCIKRSKEMIVGMLGILKAGAAYVPIDPAYPAERINFMLEDCNASIIVTSDECATKILAPAATDCICLDRDWASISNQSTQNVNAIITKNHLAYVIYTSGSTGRPKGVMIEHGNVYSFICWCRQEFFQDRFDIVYAGTSICFDLSIFEIFYPLSIGKRTRVIESGMYIGMYLPGDKDVLINAVPSVVQHLLNEGTDTSNITVMNMAGEPIPVKVQQQLDAEKIAIRNLYGPTEDTTYSSVYRLKKGERVLIGRPVSNTKFYIVNKEMELVPVGVAGQICIGGDGLARGYLNQAQLTAEKFINNPFSKQPNERLYKTGDLGRWLTDGNVEYLGRIDEQVKIRGYRIELGEIEQMLQKFDLVKQAVVIAREDKEGDKQLIGYVVADGAFNRVAVVNYLRSKLPDYMIPALWVPMESIPLTANGKVDKNALPNTDTSYVLSHQYEAPANEMELQLAIVWKEILKQDRVGVNDNFFELGGHSLNAMQLISRLHKLLNIKTSIGAIFSNPTIRQLGQALQLEKQQTFIDIKPLPIQDYYPLSHAQKRFWVLSHFKDGSQAYNVSNAFIIEGNFNIAAFRQAFDTVIERHEILRTVFVEIDGEPQQKILSLSTSKFIIEEIGLQNKTNAERFIKNFLEADARQPFDLTKGPLLRATIFCEASNKFVLVINIHHIISDGWSKAIFIKEVLHLYKTYCAGAQHNLPALPIQYKDYAAWHTASFKMQGQYWKALYEKGVPSLNFPTDFERPKLLSFFGAMAHRRLPVSLTNELRRRAVEHNMSLNNFLFALYGLLVAGYSGQDEVMIGSLTSGRSHIDLENLVGVFINFLPIKLSPKRKLHLSEYLSQSIQALIGAYNNQDYPFNLMVDDCIHQRDVSRNPFFDTMVNFHLENEIAAKADDGFEQLAETGISIKPYQAIQDDLFQSVLDFKLDIEPANDTLDFYISYNSKLFLKQTMDDFLDRFVELLHKAVNEPDNELSTYGSRVEEKEAVTVSDNIAPLTATPLTLNICASFVMEPVQEYLQYWSNEFELNIEVTFAPYNQVFQQLVNPQSLLNTGKGINVLFIRLDDWLKDKTNNPASEQINFLKQTYLELISAIENINKTSVAPFLVGIVPLYATASFTDAIAEQVNKLNNGLSVFINTQANFHLLDLDKIATLYDVAALYDAKSDELGHMPFTPEMYAALGTYLARKLYAYRKPAYKVIALDCDNTLWQGVCGELGALEVTIDEGFKQLQLFMLQKYQQGFLLVLCSKNNEADVWDVFDRNPGMILKREHIAAHRINWQPKADNLLSLAHQLNLGLDSFIFLDDSEFEIAQVEAGCPDVLSITLPENSDEFKNTLNHIWAFDYFLATEEDAKRNEMYQVEKQRKEDQVKFVSLEDFIESLNIKVTISPITNNELERAVQLTVRTNQFNLNGIRKTRDEIAGLMQEENTLAWVIEVSDRFGDYGIVGVVLAKDRSNTLVVQTFLLSCRVLGRNVEGQVLNELINYCESHSLISITALFQSTIKNKPFHEFLIRTGWMRDHLTNTYNRLLKISDQVSSL